MRRIGERWRRAREERRGGEEEEVTEEAVVTVSATSSATASKELPSDDRRFGGAGGGGFCSSHDASSSMPMLPSPLLSICLNAATAAGLILSSQCVWEFCRTLSCFPAAETSRLATGRPSFIR